MRQHNIRAGNFRLLNLYAFAKSFQWRSSAESHPSKTLIDAVIADGADVLEQASELSPLSSPALVWV